MGYNPCFLRSHVKPWNCVGRLPYWSELCGLNIFVSLERRIPTLGSYIYLWKLATHGMLN